MSNHFRTLSERLRAEEPAAPRAFRCQCGRPIFFRNSLCLNCKTPLGYETERLELFPLKPGATDGTWNLWYDDSRVEYRRCANFDTAAGCNWLLRADEPLAQAGASGLCIACRLNHTIPDLTSEVNQRHWGLMELAKRRLVSQLLGLGLPVRSKLGEDPEHGLMFDMLEQQPGGPPVMTGHDEGLITLNLAEADDSERERIRSQMKEPYRTLLGHFRHEVGHYYWDLLVRDSAWLPHVRELFGDDCMDYAEALKRNYEQGPPADWRTRFISTYASCHPWEDWAETWAHYLHMVDTVDTALSFGIHAADVELEVEPWTREALWRPDDPDADAFLHFVNAWVELTAVLNEMSRSMGQPDFYPFVLPKPTVAKLQMIHLIVQGAEP
ncbi:zinc-binding metallopeptidase family protein [Piscinibacter koreensis]|uniref:Putative zinc-binding metallopeptidase n=1 Tax=Piscinibacter koreensis TaxID=2742824 RepID=A0A7Y6NR82_9BURK|nr:putative zinc-binding metallopeptidase [Schlegelella koreensis]NUZ07811.1 putative zinc-binding metallopeptidase [Schlegelella koreensis]